MASHSVVLAGFLYLSLALSVFWLLYCLRRLDIRGARPLVVMFAGISLWVLADIVQLHTPGDSLPTLGVPLRLLGPDVTVVGGLLFALEYTGREDLLDRRAYGLLAVKPIVTLAVLVSPYRGLLVSLAPEQPVLGYSLELVPLFLVYTLYNWLIVVVAILLLGLLIHRASYSYQRQATVLLIAFLVPLFSNVGGHTGLLISDTTSVSFLVTAIMFMFAVFRLRLMDTIPVARQTVLDEMEDMVIVLDDDGTIVTVNETVRETFDIDGEIAGEPAGRLFENGALGRQDELPEEMTVTVDGEQRHLDVSVSELTDYRENLIAEVLVCRDITEEKRKAEQLRDREEDLQLLKDLQSRFLRHNLRNELNVVRANAQLMVDEDDPGQRDRYETILEKTDEIVDWSTEARDIERLVEMEDTTECDIEAEVESVLEEMEQNHPEVQFETAFEADVDIEAIPQVNRAVENVIDNAVRHNTASEPTVRVSTEQVDESVEIRVTDNGPGISTEELRRIRQAQSEPLEHGSGMGLWLVSWIVKKSGGDLVFEIGDGTTVTMRFEAVTPAPKTP